MIMQQRYEWSEAASHWDIWQKDLTGRNSMCKIPEVVLVLACKLEYIFVQPGVKRLQKKIIGEEIFGDSLNF